MSCFIKRFALKIVQKKVFVGYVYAETNTKTAIYITRQIQIVCHFWNENNYMVGITLHFVQLILTCSVLYVRCITWRVYSLRYHPMTASSPIPRGQTLNLLTLRMRWEDIRVWTIGLWAVGWNCSLQRGSQACHLVNQYIATFTTLSSVLVIWMCWKVAVQLISLSAWGIGVKTSHCIHTHSFNHWHPDCNKSLKSMINIIVGFGSE